MVCITEYPKSVRGSERRAVFAGSAWTIGLPAAQPIFERHHLPARCLDPSINAGQQLSRNGPILLFMHTRKTSNDV